MTEGIFHLDIRRCPDCERFDDYQFTDGSWICHSCGHVELPACPPAIPAGYCPICTKDLDQDGWCFECRSFPRNAA